jgi:DNA-binding transcriptional LysR family regulator
VRVRTSPLYRERYVLVTQANSELAEGGSASWAQAAQRPLCLLTPSMQNRRILDACFRAGGSDVQAMIETNSMVTLWSHVRFGNWSTVVPHTFLLLLGGQPGLVALPLTEPSVEHAVGLVASSRDPLTPMTRAFLAVARERDLAAEIEADIAHLWAMRS